MNLRKLNRAQARANELQEQYQEARNRRTAREQEIRKAENARKEATQEAERFSMLPKSAGRTTTVERARETAREAGREIHDLQQEEAKARQAWEEADARMRELARQLVPVLAEDLVRAREERVDKETQLGRVIQQALPAVDAAEEKEKGIREGFEHALRLAKPKSRQRREVEHFAKAPLNNDSEEVTVARKVLRALRRPEQELIFT